MILFPETFLGLIGVGIKRAKDDEKLRRQHRLYNQPSTLEAQGNSATRRQLQVLFKNLADKIHWAEK